MVFFCINWYWASQIFDYFVVSAHETTLNNNDIDFMVVHKLPWRSTAIKMEHCDKIKYRKQEITSNYNENKDVGGTKRRHKMKKNHSAYEAIIPYFPFNQM